MNLAKKKALAAKVLKVGKGRVWFNPVSLDDIKEAITKQDIKDLFKEGAIKIKPITGKLKKKKRKRRHAGKKKKTVKDKREYILKIRKLRSYLRLLRDARKISSKDYRKLRNYSKSGIFAGLKHLKEHIRENSEGSKKK